MKLVGLKLWTPSSAPRRASRMERMEARSFISYREQSVIRIVAALIQDRAGRVLLVRKHGTRAFMQPGGKLKDSESHLPALERELREELSCSISSAGVVFRGTFTAPAANEKGCLVEAALYQVELDGTVRPASEIEEALWLYPEPPYNVELAPLTRDRILPMALALHGETNGNPDPD
jgi:8-oxo-dGTP diphosphatase